MKIVIYCRTRSEMITGAAIQRHSFQRFGNDSNIRIRTTYNPQKNCRRETEHELDK